MVAVTLILLLSHTHTLMSLPLRTVPLLHHLKLKSTSLSENSVRLPVNNRSYTHSL